MVMMLACIIVIRSLKALSDPPPLVRPQTASPLPGSVKRLLVMSSLNQIYRVDGIIEKVRGECSNTDEWAFSTPPPGLLVIKTLILS